MNKKLLACPNCKKEKMAVPSGNYECSDCGCRFSISDKGETVPIEKQPDWVVLACVSVVIYCFIVFILHWLGKLAPDLVNANVMASMGARVMIPFIEALQTGRISDGKRETLYKRRHPIYFCILVWFIFPILIIISAGGGVYFVWRYNHPTESRQIPKYVKSSISIFQVIDITMVTAYNILKTSWLPITRRMKICRFSITTQMKAVYMNSNFILSYFISNIRISIPIMAGFSK